jgi:hypothetical protein
MARTPDGLTARSAIITNRFRPATVLKLDRLRGNESRAKFLERLIDDEEKRRNQRGKP